MKKAGLFFLIVFQFITFESRADTVICIHGFLTDWRSMKPVNATIRNCGSEVYLWNYPSRSKFIEEHACDLIPFLQQIACSCPGQPIHFVCHSIGALVLRAAINMPGCPEEAKIGKAVLLAPPNQGSCLARRFRNFLPVSLVLGKYSGWELMHYNPCQIQGFGQFPLSMKVLVIAGTKGDRLMLSSPNDGYVAIQETALNTPYYFLCYPLTHGELLLNRTVLCNIRNFIFDNN